MGLGLWMSIGQVLILQLFSHGALRIQSSDINPSNMMAQEIGDDFRLGWGE